VRSPSATPIASVAASPSVVPRAPATPPPPPQRSSIPPSFSAPAAPQLSSQAMQLEQRLGAAQIELRKLGSERHTLRARLRREADRLRELESALQAEKELRRQAADQHYTALSVLRARLAALETEKAEQQAELAAELARTKAALESALADAEAAAMAPAKQVLGLRRIRGIGPAFQRSLEQLGVTSVEQVASWTQAEVQTFAEKLKIRPERITKDDWIGQARELVRSSHD
jgi:predicted flap endonuclease-1-like 5' DNA nuclease